MPLDTDRFKDLWGDLNDALEDFIEMPAGDGDSGSDADSSAGPADESPLDQLRSAESKSKADIVLETGLTPQELLIELLTESDGRMRQQQVVDATGWSEASVSRLLTEMEKRAVVTRVQVGNEKVVFLPDHLPDAVKHSFQRHVETADRNRKQRVKHK